MAAVLRSSRTRVPLGLISAAGGAALQRVVDGYTTSFAVLLLSAGVLADRFGPRRAYLAGFALFALASVACGLARTGLVGARAGLGFETTRFASAQRAVVYPCLDWSERREHFAGPLALALLAHFVRRRWLKRRGSSRAVTLSAAGARAARVLRRGAALMRRVTLGGRPHAYRHGHKPGGVAAHLALELR